MADELWLKNGTLILVADGRKALVLRNDGPPAAPALSVLRELTAAANQPDRAQGADRPGRVAKGERRAAVAGGDFHDAAEQRFAGDAAGAFAAAAAAAPAAPLAVVAAPATLAALRIALPEGVKRRVVAEIAKDLVNHPAPEIARVLARG
jgi:protein required for attachment to host cells